MNSAQLHKTFIVGNAFTQKSFSEARRFIGSALQEVDCVDQGYKPGTSPDGVLYSWKNVPVACWSDVNAGQYVPNLNGVCFDKALWESLLQNPFLKASFDTKSFWGEDRHRDSDEIFIENVVGRLNNFHCDSHNLVLGDLDLMDTPRAIPIYAMLHTGRVGTSERGYGDLKDIAGTKLKSVNNESFQYVSQDWVVYPAFSESMMTMAETVAESIDSLSGLASELRKLVMSSLERNPRDTFLLELASCLSGKYQGDVRKAKIASAILGKNDIEEASPKDEEPVSVRRVKPRMTLAQVSTLLR